MIWFFPGGALNRSTPDLVATPAPVHKDGAMADDSATIELSRSELRAVAGYAVACARPALAIFERERPDDRRPRAAIDAAQAFADGAERTKALRDRAWAAHRAAQEARDETPSLPIPMPRWELHSTPGKPARRFHLGTGLGLNPSIASSLRQDGALAGHCRPPPAFATRRGAASGPVARSPARPWRPDRRHGRTRSSRSLAGEALTYP